MQLQKFCKFNFQFDHLRIKKILNSIVAFYSEKFEICSNLLRSIHFWKFFSRLRIPSVDFTPKTETDDLKPNLKTCKSEILLFISKLSCSLQVKTAKMFTRLSEEWRHSISCWWPSRGIGTDSWITYQRNNHVNIFKQPFNELNKIKVNYINHNSQICTFSSFVQFEKPTLIKIN